MKTGEIARNTYILSQFAAELDLVSDSKSKDLEGSTTNR